MDSVKIGVCDWGIGGLGFFRTLQTARPDLDVTYLGDQGFLPYGRVPTHELTQRMTQLAEWFRDRSVTQLVVACNAASTVLPKVHVPGIQLTGVIAPTINILLLDSTSIGIIGGRRTILSQAYRKPLVARGIPVAQRVAQPISGLIEAGKANDEETHELLRNILRPIRNSERLVLACTHYIVLEDVVREYMPSSTIIDPATEVWRQLEANLPEPTDHIGHYDFFTSGDSSQMEEQALRTFGVSAKVSPW